MANYKLNQTGEQIQNDLNLIDSNTATSGQVLTADGNGGASWQDANGGGGSGGGGSGGTQLYKHTIELGINIISARSTAYSNILDISNDDTIVAISRTGVPTPVNAMYWSDGATLVLHYYAGLDSSKLSITSTTITKINSYTPTPI